VWCRRSASLGSAERRARLAIWIVLLVASSNATLLADAVRRWSRARPEPWQPEAYAEPLDLVRASLPADSQIGYVNTAVRDEVRRRRDLFLVRYALAPRCVTRGSDPSLVLAYGAERDALAARAGMTLVRDFDNGFALYRQPGSP
jgi:hypothetical protein